MSTLKSNENSNYVVKSNDIFPIVNEKGMEVMGVSAQQIYNAASNKNSYENTVVVLGDSSGLLNHPSIADPNPSITANFAASPSIPEVQDAVNLYYYYTGWFHWLNAFLGQRFKLLAHSSVSGDSYGGMALRLQTDVIALNPKYCIIESGGNGFGVYGNTADVELAELKSIINRLLSANIIPIVSKMGYSSLITGAGGKINQWMDFNIKAQQYLRETDVITIDLQRGMGDPAFTTSAQLHGDFSLDFAHQKVSGAIRMGLNGFEDLDSLIPKVSLAPHFNSNYQTGFLNPLNVGSGGTIVSTGASGVLGNNWTIICSPSGTETCVMQKIARTDGELGEWTEYAFSGTPIDFTDSFVLVGGAVTNNNSGFVTGDSIAIYAEMEITEEFAGMFLPSIAVTWDSGNTLSTEIRNSGSAGTSDAQGLNKPFIFRGVPQVLGDELGSNTSLFLFKFSPSALVPITGKIKIGRVWLGKVN